MLLAVAIVGLAAAKAGPVEPLHPVAITVSPGQGAPRSRLSVAGSGLGSRVAATLLLGQRRLARIRADAHGSWAVTTRIPRGTKLGAYSLGVMASGRRWVALRFRIRASAKPGSNTSLAGLSTGQLLHLSPTRAPAGSRVKLVGAGFKSHQNVAVWLDNHHLTSLRARPAGALYASVVVPLNARSGSHVLSVRFAGVRLSFHLGIPGRTQSSSSPSPTPSTPTSSPPSSPPSGTSATDPVIVAAGDLACSQSDPNYNDGAGNPLATYQDDNCLERVVSDTAVSAHPSAFLTLGDNENGFPPSYNGGGKLSDYQNVYGPTFGRLNSVVYPEVGNGDFTTSTSTDDSGFMTYFTDAGVFSRIRQDGGDNSNLSNMYYSFNLGHWHIIALNTECVAVPATSLGGKGCGAGSGEDNWLKADLAAHPGMCTLAYWHHPVFNSSSQGTGNNISNLWSDLYNAHADVVLNAHGNNHYERFVPMNASGSPDSAGPTEFIVSNGGYSHGDPNGPSSTTAAGGGPNFTSFGVLQLTLHPQSYTWQFLNAYDSSTTPFSDSGSRSCHSG